VNSLGFSLQQALDTSTKLPSNNANSFKSFDNANSVVVSFYPRILASNVDKTLKPKFKILQDQGFSGSDLVSVIS
ncbi:hypothetical protein KSS87_012233, partial [Heliosperma pusillum]